MTTLQIELPDSTATAAAAGIAPMTMQQINAEVKAVRAVATR
jgi:hypothetical protein